MLFRSRTRTYTDCGNRTLGVADLALPTDVRPIVENRTTLSIDLRGIATKKLATTTTLP